MATCVCRTRQARSCCHRAGCAPLRACKKSPKNTSRCAPVVVSSASSRAMLSAVVPVGTGWPAWRKLAALPKCTSATNRLRAWGHHTARPGSSHSSVPQGSVRGHAPAGLACVGGLGVVVCDVRAAMERRAYRWQWLCVPGRRNGPGPAVRTRAAPGVGVWGGRGRAARAHRGAGPSGWCRALVPGACPWCRLRPLPAPAPCAPAGRPGSRC